MIDVNIEDTLRRIQKLEDTAEKRMIKRDKAISSGQVKLAQYIKERFSNILSEDTSVKVRICSYKVTFNVCDVNRYMDIDVNLNYQHDEKNNIIVNDISLSVDSIRYCKGSSEFDYVIVAGEIAASMKNNGTLIRKIVNVYTNCIKRVKEYDKTVSEADKLLYDIKKYTTTHLEEQLVLGFRVGDKFYIDNDGGTALINKVQNKTVTCEWYAQPKSRRYRYAKRRFSKRIDKYTLAKLIVANANTRTKKIAETVLDANIYRLSGV
jgi:hypothetical protein